MNKSVRIRSDLKGKNRGASSLGVDTEKTIRGLQPKLEPEK